MANSIRRVVLIFNQAVVDELEIALPEDDEFTVGDDIVTPDTTLHQQFPPFWETILGVDEDATLKRLFEPIDFVQLLYDKAVQRAADTGQSLISDQAPDMYYQIRLEITREEDEQQLVTALAAIETGDDGDLLRTAELEPVWSYPPSAVAYSNNPFATHQEHLRSAPWGIDAETAWKKYVAASGRDVGFVDIESGWKLTHEDLVGVTPPVWGENRETVDHFGQTIPVLDHGTAMLGLVKATDNYIGCVGIAPSCRAFVESEWGKDGSHSITDALIYACLSLLSDADINVSVGAVILIEAQQLVGGQLSPVEASSSSIRHLINLLTLNDFIVVEPAANGGHNISVKIQPDSGAIIVGAGKPIEAPYQDREWGRWDRSNFGPGVHCFARGDVVTSLSGDESRYACRTGATSGAAAIIAGAAVVLQAIMKSKGKPLSPAELRRILAEPPLGTTTKNPDEIGSMPSLGKICRAILAVENNTFGGSKGVRDVLDSSTTGEIPRPADGKPFNDYLDERRELAKAAEQHLSGSGLLPQPVATKRPTFSTPV